MIQNVVRTLTFMYSSLDRWVLSEVFSFQSLIFHWCLLKKTNIRINFNISRDFLGMFLYTCIKTRILLFLPFGFSLNISKILFQEALSFQQVLSLIRLNHSHNHCHCGCQQHSANVTLSVCGAYMYQCYILNRVNALDFSRVSVWSAKLHLAEWMSFSAFGNHPGNFQCDCYLNKIAQVDYSCSCI